MGRAPAGEQILIHDDVAVDMIGLERQEILGETVTVEVGKSDVPQSSVNGGHCGERQGRRCAGYDIEDS